MKKILCTFIGLMLPVFIFAQRPSSYGDILLDNGVRRIESHPVKLYEQYYTNSTKKGVACALVYAFDQNSEAWCLCLGIREGRIHIAENSPLYFGYPQNGLCESVLKISTDEGTKGLVDDYCQVYYQITEEQIKLLISDNRIEQVLIYTSDGNIGKFLKNNFQKKLAKEYEFVKEQKNKKCNNTYRYNPYIMP